MTTFEELIETLEDETASSYSRRSAISALVRLGDERAVQPLITVLQNEDPYIRREAAKALGDMGSPGAVEPLVEALRDSEDNVRRNAIVALGTAGDERAIEPLKQMLQDESFLTRSEAERSIKKIEARMAESIPAEEAEPDVEEVQPIVETENASADVPDEQEIIQEEAALSKISEPEDSPVESVEEVEEFVEQPAVETEQEDELPQDRKLADEAERFISEPISAGEESSILIQFDGNRSSFKPGEVMRGRVLLRVAKEIKSRGIYLSVEGKEKVKWTEGSGNNSRTYKDEHIIINETIPLSVGQEEMKIGNYRYTFECYIPEDSPPPYHSKVCNCEYSVSAHVDVPMRRDIKDERSFHVSRLPIDEEGQMNPVFATARHISQDIKLSLRLEDTVYHIGSQLKGTITLQNNSKRKIRGIDVQLLHQEYARCRGKSRMFSSRDRVKETIHKTSVLRIPVPDENTREFRIDFAMKIPSSAEETGSWNLFHLDAIVKASLDLAWAKDVSCSHKIDIMSAL